MADMLITIVTTTYNRLHTLPRLVNSLLAQDSSKFLWILIDDGSTDGTKEWFFENFESWKFKSFYFYQKNSGKHKALNLSFEKVETEWIFIVDSDDELTVDAVGRISRDILLYNDAIIRGLCYRKAFRDRRIIGIQLEDSSPVFSNPTEMGRLLKGDLAYIFKTSELKRNKFPEIVGEKFFPELFLWNKVSDSGKILFFPGDPIYLCEYLEDGYTKNFKKNLRNNPVSFRIYYRDQIGRETKLLNKIKMIIRYFQCTYYAYGRRRLK